MRLIRDGEKWGGGVWRWGEREIIYLSVLCHHQNDFTLRWAAIRAICFIMVRDKSQDSVHRSQLLKRREKDSRSGFEPRFLCLPA